MKVNMLKLLPVMILLALLSCKKDDDLSTTELITHDSGWKFIAMTSDPPIDFGGTQVTDVFAQFPACDKDDITIFKEGGIVNFDEGATKCDPNDPQTTPGIWALSADEKFITVDGESQEILELTKSTMKVRFDYVDPGSGITYKWTGTLNHP